MGQFAVVADGRREADELDVGGRLDDDLFPHRSAREVVDVVHLVQHHVAHLVETGQVLVDEVAQDLGGHDHDRGAVVDGVLTGNQADLRGAVLLHEVVVLLVAQGLEGCRVDDPGPLTQGTEVAVVGHHRLST